MTISSVLQISLISEREWSSLFSRMELLQKQLTRNAQTWAHVSSYDVLRRMSEVSDISFAGEPFSPPDMTLWDSFRSNLKED
jgi:hypothetical protein